MQYTELHGLTDEILAACPTFAEIYSELAEVVRDKTIIFYDSGFEVEK